MKSTIETKRLILREIIPSDEEKMFALDSDPLVNKFLGNNPITTLEQAKYYINFIRLQYEENGIGRWAVIEKESNLFIGWSGLKFHTEMINNHILIYELGYRFMPEYWGKGYATEAAAAWVDYGFGNLDIQSMYAMTDALHTDSKNVLKKTGFLEKGIFDFENNPENPHCWFEMTKAAWKSGKQLSEK